MTEVAASLAYPRLTVECSTMTHDDIMRKAKRAIKRMARHCAGQVMLKSREYLRPYTHALLHSHCESILTQAIEHLRDFKAQPEKRGYDRCEEAGTKAQTEIYRFYTELACLRLE